jgi:hypothetical protein
MHAKISLSRWRTGALAALLEAKAPTGDEESFTGSGEWDYGAGLLLSAGGPRHAFHGGISHYVIGQPDFMPFEIEDRTSMFFGWEWILRERWSLAVQGIAANSIIEDNPDNRNDRERLDVAIGAHYGRNRWQVSFGFIEGLTTNDNNADISFFLASKWRL